MSNIFKHEEKYRGKLDFNKKILVCGCGAIGSNLIENLYRQGFTNITALDFDRVEKENINTQVWSFQDIGLTKTQAMQNKVFMSVKQKLDIINAKLDKSNATKILKGYDLIIDAFDNTEARHILKNVQNTPVLHGGLYEDYAECIWNERYIVPDNVDGIDVCDYPLARNIAILLAVVMTEEIISFSQNKKRRNLSITLKDLKISEIK